MTMLKWIDVTDDLAFYLNLEGENRRRTVTRYDKNDRAPKDDRPEEISKILNININSIKNYDLLNKYLISSGIIINFNQNQSKQQALSKLIQMQFYQYKVFMQR